VRCDRSVDCEVCTAQLDYYSTDHEAPGYVIDGPDGRALRVCCYTCEEELITGKSYRFNAPQSFDVRGRVIVGS
jgi:hypothetical protein